MVKKSLRRHGKVGTRVTQVAPAATGMADSLWHMCLSSPMRAIIASSSLVSVGLVLSTLLSISSSRRAPEIENENQQPSFDVTPDPSEEEIEDLVRIREVRNLRNDAGSIYYKQSGRQFQQELREVRDDAAFMSNRSWAVFVFILLSFTLAAITHALDISSILSHSSYWLGVVASVLFRLMDHTVDNGDDDEHWEK